MDLKNIRKIKNYVIQSKINKFSSSFLEKPQFFFNKDVALMLLGGALSNNLLNYLNFQNNLLKSVNNKGSNIILMLSSSIQKLMDKNLNFKKAQKYTEEEEKTINEEDNEKNDYLTQILKYYGIYYLYRNITARNLAWLYGINYDTQESEQDLLRMLEKDVQKKVKKLNLEDFDIFIDKDLYPLLKFLQQNQDVNSALMRAENRDMKVPVKIIRVPMSESINATRRLFNYISMKPGHTPSEIRPERLLEPIVDVLNNGLFVFFSANSLNTKDIPVVSSSLRNFYSLLSSDIVMYEIKNNRNEVIGVLRIPTQRILDYLINGAIRPVNIPENNRVTQGDFDLEISTALADIIELRRRLKELGYNPLDVGEAMTLKLILTNELYPNTNTDSQIEITEDKETEYDIPELKNWEKGKHQVIEEKNRRDLSLKEFFDLPTEQRREELDRTLSELTEREMDTSEKLFRFYLILEKMEMEGSKRKIMNNILNFIGFDIDSLNDFFSKKIIFREEDRIRRNFMKELRKSLAEKQTSQNWKNLKDRTKIFQYSEDSGRPQYNLIISYSPENVVVKTNPWDTKLEFYRIYGSVERKTRKRMQLTNRLMALPLGALGAYVIYNNIKKFLESSPPAPNE